MNRISGKANQSARRPRARGLKPGVEALEGRLVPATFQVTTLADVVNPNDGVLSLREAISAANATPAADTVVLMAGVHQISRLGQFENGNATGDFDITAPLTIVGRGMNVSVVDAVFRDRVFDVIGRFDVTFSKMAIRNGLTDNPTAGAGIFALDANLKLNGTLVTRNQGTNGAGVWAGNGNVTLAGSRLISNRGLSDRGGGLEAVNGNVVLTDSVVAHNSSLNGGGIHAGKGAVTLVRSTVAGNRAIDNGGGIYCGANVVSLTDSVVRTNTAGSPAEGNVGGLGGGVFTAAAVLTRSSVRGNFAHLMGGGLYAFNNATLTRSTVSGNVASSRRTDAGAGNGGGMVATVSFLRESTVSGNVSSGSGGGIHSAVSCTMVGSTVSGNTAWFKGGGLSAAAVNLINSTISGNTAGAGGTGAGGGIDTARGNILHCTITENFSVDLGGGVFWAQNTDRIRVKNTIIAGNNSGNAGEDVWGDFVSAGHNLIGIVNGSTGFGAAGDQLGTADDPLDAMLTALGFHGGPTMTHGLLAGSTAIDRGDNAGATGIDQRGVARPRDGDGNGSRVVDIGAVER